MFLWNSLLCFYGITALLDICGAFKNVNRKVLTGFLILPMFILVAFRAEYVGPDTQAYSASYSYIALFNSMTEALQNARMEDGYVFFEYLCSQLGISYSGFQVFVSAFVYYSFYRFIHKYSRYIAVSCFLVFANNCLFGTMNVVRMWIAVAILLYAIEALLNHRFKRYVIIVLIASCFHTSALCFIIVYPLRKVRWTKKNLSIVFLSGIGITLFARQIFEVLLSIIGKYENYLSRFEQSNLLATWLGLIVEILFFIFITVTYKKYISTDNPEYELMQLLYTIHIIAVCISLVGLSNNIMGRVSHYFTTYSLISIPIGLAKIRNPRSRLVFSAVLILCLGAKFFVILYYRPEWYQVIPYGFFGVK